MRRKSLKDYYFNIEGKKKVAGVLCIMIGIILGSLFTLNNSAFIIVFLGFLIGIVTILLTSESEDCKFLTRIFIFSFLTRIILALLFYYISILQGQDGFLFNNDGIDASYNAWEIAKLWRSGFFVDIEAVRSFCPSTRLVPYHYFNAFIYYFIGWNPLAMFFINCTAGALSIILVFKIAKCIFNRKIALVSSVLYSLWPSVIFWSTTNLKEALIALFICLVMIFSLKLRIKFNICNLFLTAISILLLNRLQMIVSSLVVLALGLSFLFPFRKTDNLKLLLRSIIIGGIIFTVIFVGNFRIFSWGGTFFKELFTSYMPGENIFKVIDYAHNVRTIDASTAFFPNIDLSSFKRVLAYLPFGLLVVLLEPLPWKAAKLLQFLVIPEMVLWYCLLPFFFRGIFIAIIHRISRSFAIIILVMLTFFTLALFEGNVGTVFRHRAHILPFYIVISAFGLLQKKYYLRNILV